MIMTDIQVQQFWTLAITACVLIWLNGFRFPAKEPVTLDETSAHAFNSWFYSLRWWQKLNAGAALAGVFWLLGNGMWFSAFLYIIAAFVFPPAVPVIALALLLFGSNMSWRTGARWGYDFRAFNREQSFWAYWGVYVIAPLNIFVILS